MDWFAMAFFCCGWLALPEYIKQVFYLDQEEEEDEKDAKECSNPNLMENGIPIYELNIRQDSEECYIFDQNGKIISDIESVRLKKRREKLIQIMIYS